MSEGLTGMVKIRVRNTRNTAKRRVTIQKHNAIAKARIDAAFLQRFPHWIEVAEVLQITPRAVKCFVTHHSPPLELEGFIQFYRAHQAASKEKRRAKDAAYRVSAREQRNEYYREYGKRNKAMLTKRHAEWRNANRESLREVRRELMRKKRKQPEERLLHALRNRVYGVLIRRAGVKKSAATRKLLGAEPGVVRKWLERQFLPGMSWTNYGQWHIDHVIPCAAFNLASPEDQRRCFHYKNLQPLWAEDNVRKSDRLSTPIQPTLALL